MNLNRNNLNKKELIQAIAMSANISEALASKAYDGVFENITNALKKGAEVRLVGFGTFCVVNRKATEGRNPRTGVKIMIPATRVPKFKAGRDLKNAVSGDHSKIHFFHLAYSFIQSDHMSL